MPAELDMGRLARVIGDPTRMNILVLLMEGRALTAKELAWGVGVGAPTCTVHLRRLLDDALVVSTSQGRHKYYRLASSEVARCVESLMTIASRAVTPAAQPDSSMRQARMCYDHLAGQLGMKVMDALLARRLLAAEDRNFTVTGKGERKLAELGIDLPVLRHTRRRFACGCLDWSERRDHLGGALGAAVAAMMLKTAWLRRKPDSRVVSVTQLGKSELAAHFQIDWPS
jgi:DNA-binding transcriptional ArsR family regulator